MTCTRSSSIDRSRSLISWFDFDVIEIDQEKTIYSWLIENDDRLLYSIILIEKIKNNSKIHCELLRFWQDNWRADYHWKNDRHIYESWQMFKKQLKKWQNFRKWQHDNCELDDDDFSTYVEWKKRMKTLLFVSKWVVKTLFKIEVDSFYFKEDWETYQDRRAAQRYYCRESDYNDDFFIYVKAMKRRLTQHEFTESFQLLKNLMQQDALTTWVEYLNFEYFWLDWFSNAIQRLKLNRDKIWQKLIDFKMLRSHEIETFLWTFKSLNQSSADKKHAWKTVEKTTSKIKQICTLTQSDSRRMNISQQIHIRLLWAVKRALLTAKIRLTSVKRRADFVLEFIRETNRYNSMIQNESCHCLFLSWILNQVSLLQMKLIQFKTTALSSRIKDIKKKFDVSNDSLKKRDLKKQKFHHRKISLFVNDEVATKIKMNEEKHQQILKYDEKFISHNMIRRSKVKKFITSQLDCC